MTRGSTVLPSYIRFCPAFFFVHATPSARHKFAGTKRNETQEGAHRALCLASRDPPITLTNQSRRTHPFFHPLSKRGGGAKVARSSSFFLSFSALLALFFPWFGPLFLAPDASSSSTFSLELFNEIVVIVYLENDGI